MTAQVSTLVATWGRLQAGGGAIDPDPVMGHAENFLYMLTGVRPDATAIHAFDVALTLHADHELNASTFAGRVAAATLTDIYSAVVAAIGTLKGPLHGGANADVMRMLLELGETATADRVDEVIRGKLARKEKIPGFGHRVYRTEDPRATHLRADVSLTSASEPANPAWFAMSEQIEALVMGEKKLNPERRFLLCVHLLRARDSNRSLHADLRCQPDVRLDSTHPRTVREQPADPAPCGLRRPVTPTASHPP